MTAFSLGLHRQPVRWIALWGNGLHHAVELAVKKSFGVSWIFRALLVAYGSFTGLRAREGYHEV